MIGFVLWADAVMRELARAGFTAERLEGCPFVPHILAGDWVECCPVLFFSPTIPTERFFYRGGTLYIPAGMSSLRKGTPV
jgi:hypothetical protein